MTIEAEKLQALGADIVTLMMKHEAPPRRAVVALLSVLLPTLHQEGFTKDSALRMVAEYWDGIVEQSFKAFQEERRNGR
jgi:predicted nucleic acid-binding Zn ribbon protein